MSPRREHEGEFADFELVNDCAFAYGKKKTYSEEPAKNTTISKKSIATQCTPIATDMDKVKEAITELQVKVLDVSAETATQFEKIQTAVDDFGEQRVTQDRRMRKLEYSYDDYETDLKKCTHSIGILKELLETIQSASGKVADLRETCKENTARSIESSSRLDFMVGYHLPSIEQNIKAVQIAQSESGSVSVDLRRTISLLKCQLGDLTEMHVAEIQQIAESADLRSKDVQSGLAHFIKNVIPEFEDKIHELAYTSAKACKDSVASIAAISKDVKALQMDQESHRKAMAVDIENLATVDSQLIDETFKSKSRLDDVEEAVKTLSSKGDAMTVELEKMSTLETAIDEANHETKHRVSRAEHVIQHLVGKVLPLLKSRVQEHQELVQISKETAALEKAKSAEREAMFFKRIEELEAKTSRCNIASMQNLQLQVRVSSLEKMLNEIAGEVNQVRLQEQKVQLHPSIASAFAQTEESTIDEINEEIDELIEEVIEEAIEEVKMERSENVAPPAPKAADNGSITIQCKTFLGEAFTVPVPPFVSIRYLKQLIFFKSGCSMHPTAQSLVYAGKVLQDGWKVGGGMFISSFGESNENDWKEFGGLKEGSIVLIVV